jgi:hypothetical protein
MRKIPSFAWRALRIEDPWDDLAVKGIGLGLSSVVPGGGITVFRSLSGIYAIWAIAFFSHAASCE